MMKPNVLVIGASGQIGCALLDAFQSVEVPFIGVDTRPNGWISGAITMQTDIRNLGSDIFPSVTDVIHLASEASAQTLEQNLTVQRDDEDVFFYALNLAKKIGARFIIVSSRERFGMKSSEVFLGRRLNAYEQQKQKFEQALAEEQENGMCCGILRIPVAIGAYDTDLFHAGRLIPRWCRQIAAEKEIEISEPLKQIELLPVRDVATRLMELIFQEESFVEDLHGDLMTISELAGRHKEIWGQLKTGLLRNWTGVDRCVVNTFREIATI